MCVFARMRSYACLHAVAALTCQRASECRHVYTHFRIIVAALTCLLVRECRRDFGSLLLSKSPTEVHRRFSSLWVCQGFVLISCFCLLRFWLLVVCRVVFVALFGVFVLFLFLLWFVLVFLFLSFVGFLPLTTSLAFGLVLVVHVKLAGTSRSFH